MRAVTALCQDIAARHGITPPRVLGHSDIAPARKIDPGEKFDWPGLARDGVGFWVPPVAIDIYDSGFGPGDAHEDIAQAQRLLARYGYGIIETGVFDDATRFVVENGRHAIDWLIEQGVPFTRDDLGYHLTRCQEHDRPQQQRCRPDAEGDTRERRLAPWISHGYGYVPE